MEAAALTGSVGHTDRFELCENWYRRGECRAGDKCPYAHGLHEVRYSCSRLMLPSHVAVQVMAVQMFVLCCAIMQEILAQHGTQHPCLLGLFLQCYSAQNISGRHAKTGAAKLQSTSQLSNHQQLFPYRLADTQHLSSPQRCCHHPVNMHLPYAVSCITSIPPKRGSLHCATA